MSKRTLHQTKDSETLNIILGMWKLWLYLLIVGVIVGVGLFCQGTVSQGHQMGLI